MENDQFKTNKDLSNPSDEVRTSPCPEMQKLIDMVLEITGQYPKDENRLLYNRT